MTGSSSDGWNVFKGDSLNQEIFWAVGNVGQLAFSLAVVPVEACH